MRLEASREFTIRGRAVTPCSNVEWFFGPEDEAWIRTLHQGGAEFTVSPHFRYEVHLARQIDHGASPPGLGALGVFLKRYR